MPEIKNDEVAKVTRAFIPHAPHPRAARLLNRLSKETVIRAGDFCDQSDRISLRTLAMLVDYHAVGKTETWQAEREIDILIALLSHRLYNGGVQAWREMDNFVYHLEEHELISSDGFCITDTSTRSLVLGAYFHRFVTSGGYPDASHARWLGDNVERLKPLLGVLKERGETSRDLITALWEIQSPSLSSGTL
jgi:hypothetical protein